MHGVPDDVVPASSQIFIFVNNFPNLWSFGIFYGWLVLSFSILFSFHAFTSERDRDKSPLYDSMIS